MFICPTGVRTGKSGDPIEEAPGRGARVRFSSVRDEFGNHLTVAGDVDGAAAFSLGENGGGVVAQIAHAKPLGPLVLVDDRIGDSDIPASHRGECSTDACYTNSAHPSSPWSPKCTSVRAIR